MHRRAVGYREGSKGGGEGHCVEPSFQIRLEGFHRGSVPEFIRESVPELWGGGTEGATSHCGKIGAGNVKSDGVAGAKIASRSADGDEIAQVAGTFLVNGLVG